MLLQIFNYTQRYLQIFNYPRILCWNIYCSAAIVWWPLRFCHMHFLLWCWPKREKKVKVKGNRVLFAKFDFGTWNASKIFKSEALSSITIALSNTQVSFHGNVFLFFLCISTCAWWILNDHPLLIKKSIVRDISILFILNSDPENFKSKSWARYSHSYLSHCSLYPSRLTPLISSAGSQTLGFLLGSSTCRWERSWVVCHLPLSPQAACRLTTAVLFYRRPPLLFCDLLLQL